MKKFYVCTAIPYVNAKAHIGHAMDFLYADILARYHRQQGENVRFSIGTDEHGAKIAEKAEEQKEWLESFRTRLFGSVENVDHAFILTGDQSLNHLSAGDEFAMREGNQLLKFWLPRID